MPFPIVYNEIYLLNTYLFSGFESKQLNDSERNDKTNHDIQIAQNLSLCFGKNDIRYLNQTFVHLKPLDIDCLSSTGEEIESYSRHQLFVYYYFLINNRQQTAYNRL